MENSNKFSELHKYQLPFKNIINDTITYIGSDTNPFFITKNLVKKVMEEEVINIGQEYFNSLKDAVSHFFGNTFKILQKNGYITKFSRRCWKRLKNFSPQDVQSDERIIHYYNLWMQRNAK